jgi:tetratricopeptide (TPR) repeat protein
MLRLFALSVAISSLFAVTPDAAPSAERAAKLAETGHCLEALPQLKKALPATKEPELKRRAGVAGVRCGMTLNRPAEAVFFLDGLNREFPHDPAVLYLASHVYSDLSIRASNELMYTNPGSPQVHQLNAEALEMQSKWDEAEAEYRAVLKIDPRMPGIHYRLGRLLLSKPAAPGAGASIKEDAKREFEDELKIDPANAGAEFVLGELARQAEQWPAAIDHFIKATTLDNSFVDAHVGLGRSYLESGEPAKAIAPLEMAVKLFPAQPSSHFYLATAYRRSGRKEEAEREFAAHKAASEKAQQATDNVKATLQGVKKQ